MIMWVQMGSMKFWFTTWTRRTPPPLCGMECATKWTSNICAMNAWSISAVSNLDSVHTVASTFGKIWADMSLFSPGSSPTLAVPRDLVHCVEGHATGLYWPYAQGSYRKQPIFGTMVPSMDGVPRTMEYHPTVIRLRGGRRCHAVQPDWCAVDSSLSCF